MTDLESNSANAEGFTRLLLATLYEFAASAIRPLKR
jgi:hypothetical protein